MTISEPANGFLGRVVLVTGAANGIGRATAEAFGRAGARLVLADINGEGIAKLAADLTRTGVEAIAVTTDVSDERQVAAAVTSALDAYGRLDCAFNNAGVFGPPSATHEYSEAEWDRVLGVNLKGVWLCMKHELTAMLPRGGGAIVNMSSMWGQVGFADSTPAYVASKHGVLGLTRTAALEYAEADVRVNAVCPGVIHTEAMNARLDREPGGPAAIAVWAPMNRLGRPAEVADAVLWLCSDAASYVTGHALSVDGGYLAR